MNVNKTVLEKLKVVDLGNSSELYTIKLFADVFQIRMARVIDLIKEKLLLVVIKDGHVFVSTEEIFRWCDFMDNIYLQMIAAQRKQNKIAAEKKEKKD